jgi:hypothetical protein
MVKGNAVVDRESKSNTTNKTDDDACAKHSPWKPDRAEKPKTISLDIL